MRILRSLPPSPPEGARAAVALGVFDGVHLGHRAILAAAMARARAEALVAVACTFDPHPMQVLQPARAPLPISTLAERLDLVAAAGLDCAVVLPFTAALAAVEAEQFVEDVLVGRLGARVVVVGDNHRFGRGARGDAGMLARLGERLGFRAHVVPPLVVGGVTVSSSEIRTRLRTGDVAGAARLLGRPYTLAGEVIRGAGRGRHLGFATANLAPDRPLLVPTGVYACRAEVDGGQWAAVANIGMRPTFGEPTLSVEAHLLDFRDVLYGRHVRLALVDRLRDERQFAGPDELRAQIARDVETARLRLASAGFTSPGHDDKLHA